MGAHALYTLIEYLVNLCMNRVVGMSYTHELHEIVSLYTHMCFLYMYASNFNEYQFQLVFQISYIQMYDLIVLVFKMSLHF